MIVDIAYLLLLYSITNQYDKINAHIAIYYFHSSPTLPNKLAKAFFSKSVWVGWYFFKYMRGGASI